MEQQSVAPPGNEISSSNIEPTPVKDKEMYANELRELSDKALADQLSILVDGFNRIQDFDPGKSEHMDLRNRMLAAQQVTGERGLLDGLPPASPDKDTDDDPGMSGSYALRVGGGVDVVSAKGDILSSRPASTVHSKEASTPKPLDLPDIDNRARPQQNG
ncbi:hypothetical protein EPO04_03760 [Patescibacteria group bacterium]|nr:MAG: hypothetical protein EPO04_03760 [Patescibacteria group bacterium]